ncbi:YaaR family protein [Abyssisolibacter fermentans]|uniref:YaaR family protein n=1 Tax=Abyssisolibacter fermentans TaxID=1766203 RepID=UPI00082F7CDC|nr:YaaR family protein [Abyssisolibacter fermentans]
MKVSDILTQSTNTLDVKQNDPNKKQYKLEKTFKDEFKRLGDISVKEKLNILLKRIDVQSERIVKNMDVREVIAYKKLISEFLKESVDSMVKFSKNSFLDRRGRHRVFAIVKKVDKEMEQLTKDVLKNEKDNIKILKRLDDIRGLIIDIYM